MTDPSKARTVALVVAPAITGCISSLASLTLIVSIFRSSEKLKTVFRRLIFSLSVFDIIQSFSQVLSSAPMPKGTQWGAIGNETTCDLQGFFTVFGICGTGMYTLSLAIYSLLVVKFEKSEAKIKKHAEPFLHAFPILYSLTVSIVMYATNNYNTVEFSCWIGPKPLNCDDDSEVECLSSGNANILMLIGITFPTLVVFAVNCIILVVIWCALKNQIKKNQVYGNVHLASSDEENLRPVESYCYYCPIRFCPIMSCNSRQSNGPTPSVLNNYLSRPSRVSIRRLKDISNRTIAYTTAFLLTFIFAIINHIVGTYGIEPTPFIIIFLARVFFPLQGLFNILVYTYPHVASYRRNHSDHNWFRAFWEVIKSGGDSDQPIAGRIGRRRWSLRKQRKMLAQNERRRRNSIGSMVTSPTDKEKQGGKV